MGWNAVELRSGHSSTFGPTPGFRPSSRRRGKLLGSVELLRQIDFALVDVSQSTTIANPDALWVAVAKIADDDTVFKFVEVGGPKRTDCDTSLAGYAAAVVNLSLARDPVTGPRTGGA